MTCQSVETELYQRNAPPLFFFKRLSGIVQGVTRIVEPKHRPGKTTSGPARNLGNGHLAKDCLAHVRFGTKTVEVATFRRQVSAQELAAADEAADEGIPVDHEAEASRDRLVHRDNTFGTPEEDAFRRDFTINALFYDIGTFSIIDYTGGLEDLDRELERFKAFGRAGLTEISLRLHDDPHDALKIIGERVVPELRKV